MKEFLQAVSDFHAKRLSRVFRLLAETQMPCGLFYVRGAEELPTFLQFLTKRGSHVTMIVNFGQPLPDSPVPVVSVRKFAALGAKPGIMFISDGGLPACFQPYFAQWGIDSLYLEHPDRIDGLIEYYDAHLLDLYESYADYQDAASRRAFLGAMVHVATCNIGDFRLAPEPQYFLEGFTVRPGDIVIDGGAFDGVTSRDFLAAAGPSGKVFAFEMDGENFPACAENAAKYGFVAENMGLAEKTQTASFQRGENVTASCMVEGGNRTAQFTSIDDYVAARGLSRVDFIKMDIEGAELAALHGAAQTIARCKPRMAICVYHKPEDMWVLQRYIRSLRPDYTFAFRHYPVDVTEYLCTDSERALLRSYGLPYAIPGSGERVLYCR